MGSNMNPVFVNSVVSNAATLGENVYVGKNCIIEEDVVIGDNTYIDHNVIIKSGVRIGANSYVGCGCILGECTYDQIRTRGDSGYELLTIGDDALIRSGSIIYSGSSIGSNFQTGHQVTIREKTQIGLHVSLGTLCDIQGYCVIGNYVRAHSNVHIGQATVIDDYVWIFPYVVFTNDPTPPSEQMVGVHVSSFAIVATGSLLMPGVQIGGDSLVGAGAVVTKDVEPYAVVLGSPAKRRGDVRNIKNRETGEPSYPWREHFSRNMPWDELGFEAWYNSLDIASRPTIE